MQLTFVTRAGLTSWDERELDSSGLVSDRVLMKWSVWKGVTCASAVTSTICWSRTVQTALVIVAVRIIRDFISSDETMVKPVAAISVCMSQV